MKLGLETGWSLLRPFEVVMGFDLNFKPTLHARILTGPLEYVAKSQWIPRLTGVREGPGALIEQILRSRVVAATGRCDIYPC